MIQHLLKLKESIPLIAMRIIFRADASRKIGSGHVMRSSMLAEEAVFRGHECIFIGQIDDLSWVEKYILQLGYSDVFHNENQYLPNKSTDTLILDSYSIDPSSSFISRENWKQVLSISDLLTPPYYSDIELRPGFFEVNRIGSRTRVLTGPEYVLVRRGTQKSKRIERPGLPLKVLVTGGGSDPFGFVEEICKVLPTLNLSLEVHVFSARVFAAKNLCEFVNHPLGRSLDVIASDVDVVLTTASTSSLEFIAREIPCGIVCAVDNQRELYDQLGQMSYAMPIGTLHSDGVWSFDREGLMKLLSGIEQRNEIRFAISGLVDLKGPSRVLNELEKKISQ